MEKEASERERNRSTETWCVVAPGPSLRVEDVQRLKGCCKVVAVSDSYLLAPFADVVVSADRKWWEHHPAARAMDCRKFSIQETRGVEQFKSLPMGSNSALLGAAVAVSFGAVRVLLLGLDLAQPGLHFFGKHPEHFRPANQKRFETFKRQFESFRPKGVHIVNCTVDSALTCYMRGKLEDLLAESATQSA